MPTFSDLPIDAPIDPIEAPSARPSQSVSQWIHDLRASTREGPPPQDVEAALEELQTAYEELRVAEEDLIVKNEMLETAQIALVEERQRYQELFELAPDGYLITDLRGVIQEANYAAAAMLGIEARFLLGKPLVNFVPTALRSQFRGVIKQVNREKQGVWQSHFQPRHRAQIPVQITIATGGGNAASHQTLRWLVRDISDSQRAAAALHEANQLLSSLINAAPVAIFMINRERHITLWNPAATQIFGWSAEEVVGQPLPDVPPPFQATFERLWRESAGGTSHQGVEIQHWNRVGEPLQIALWTAPLFDIDGQLSSVVALITDISERKLAEVARQELLARLVKVQEEERARISRELHDNLGQHLTAIMLGLDSMQTDAEPLPGGEHKRSTGRNAGSNTGRRIERAAELRASIEGLASAAHRLAWELRPAELDDMGLEVALRQYCRDWAERTGLDIEFQSRGFANRRLDDGLETALYRVTQEALTNIARHAHARTASVVLDFRDGQAVTIIADDGQGFDPSAATGAAHHRLGLLGMRERIGQVGGSLEIESEVGQGTSVSCAGRKASETEKSGLASRAKLCAQGQRASICA